MECPRPEAMKREERHRQTYKTKAVESEEHLNFWNVIYAAITETNYQT